MCNHARLIRRFGIVIQFLPKFIVGDLTHVLGYELFAQGPYRFMHQHEWR